MLCISHVFPCLFILSTSHISIVSLLAMVLHITWDDLVLHNLVPALYLSDMHPTTPNLPSTLNTLAHFCSLPPRFPNAQPLSFSCLFPHSTPPASILSLALLYFPLRHLTLHNLLSFYLLVVWNLTSHLEYKLHKSVTRFILIHP